MASWRGPSRPTPADSHVSIHRDVALGLDGDGLRRAGARPPEQPVDVFAGRGRAAPSPREGPRRSSIASSAMARARAAGRSWSTGPACPGSWSNATMVPMGLEVLGYRPILRCAAEIPATGRTLRDVLDAMVAYRSAIRVARDGRRHRDPAHGVVGTIPGEPLVQARARRCGCTTCRRRRRSSGSRGSWVTAVRLGSGSPDGRPLSIDAPQGTILDFANTIVRAHGEMLWTLEPTTRLGASAGYRYTFNFGVMGGGGLGFEVR